MHVIMTMLIIVYMIYNDIIINAMISILIIIIIMI
mgnify:CR=1 FL=1